MLKSYVAISAVIFALVAIGHIARIVQEWHVQLGDMGGCDVRLVGCIGSERRPCALGCDAPAAVMEVARSKLLGAAPATGQDECDVPRISDVCDEDHHDRGCEKIRGSC
jgi:hypothetical protein